MEIKTFRGKELQLVMGDVRESVGDEALILDTRHLPDRSVEIDVAIGAEAAPPRTQRHRAAPITLDDQRIEDEHPAIDLLRESGFRAPLLHRLAEEMGRSGSLLEDIATAFRSSLSFDSALAPRRQGDPRVVALVGPTGVGKTTTLAKLAAQLRLAFDIKIGFISADSFRVGAAHQLQTYATLLNVPCRTICPPGTQRTGAGMVERIDEALSEFRGLDLVLVDTAGVSARDRERLTLLQESLGSDEFIERMLVLQAPSNERDLMHCAEAFAPLQYSRLIVTKLDETRFAGPVLNLAHKLRLPLAFLCSGQRVPEDIEPASAKRLAWMATNGIH